MKEMFLICDNWVSASSSYQFTRNIVSNKNRIFSVFYSFKPFSYIEVEMVIQTTLCQGIYVQSLEINNY